MKFKNLIKKRRWRYPIYVFGFLLVVGTVGEFLPWTRGWFHDLRWVAGQIVNMQRKGFSFSEQDEYLQSLIPTEDSPEGIELKQQFDDWYSGVIERYPKLRVDYKNVPEDENGILHIYQWQEEVRSEKNRAGKSDAELRKIIPSSSIPDKFLEMAYAGSDNVPPENYGQLEAYLTNRKEIIDRAITIGLMPNQSTSHLPIPQLPPFLLVSWAKEITDLLALNALLEAEKGDADAALQSMKAVRGWGKHFRDCEAPTLVQSTLGTAIELRVRRLIYWKILPLLSEKDLDLSQWAALMKNKESAQQLWMRRMRGECLYISYTTSYWSPGDSNNLKDAWAETTNYLIDPDNGYLHAADNKLESPYSLSVGNRLIHYGICRGFTEYTEGFIRSQIELKQIEIAFMLRKLEAEGQDLMALNQKTLETLPLDVLPDIRLVIDFDKRMISFSATTDWNISAEPQPF